MKTTIREQLEKIHKIDHAILTVEGYLPKDYFPGQEPLCDVINLLSEYREFILDGKVDI